MIHQIYFQLIGNCVNFAHLNVNIHNPLWCLLRLYINFAWIFVQFLAMFPCSNKKIHRFHESVKYSLCFDCLYCLSYFVSILSWCKQLSGKFKHSVGVFPSLSLQLKCLFWIFAKVFRKILCPIFCVYFF